MTINLPDTINTDKDTQQLLLVHKGVIDINEQDKIIKHYQKLSRVGKTDNERQRAMYMTAELKRAYYESN